MHALAHGCRVVEEASKNPTFSQRVVVLLSLIVMCIITSSGSSSSSSSSSRSSSINNQQRMPFGGRAPVGPAAGEARRGPLNTANFQTKNL